jgi:hypothetical protein
MFVHNLIKQRFNHEKKRLVCGFLILRQLFYWLYFSTKIDKEKQNRGKLDKEAKSQPEYQ